MTAHKVYPCSGVRHQSGYGLSTIFKVGGRKVCIIGPGHMTKMATTPIYGKTLKDLQNQRSYDLETSHAALGTQALQSFYK